MSSIASYLLDTNVVSEAKKLRPNPKLTDFLSRLPRRHAYISVLSLGELRIGAARLGRRDPIAAQALSRWIGDLEIEFHDRILPISREIALLWGTLSGDRSRPPVDTLLAATAIQHGFTFVTRNTRDVQDLPVSTLNPWLG